MLAVRSFVKGTIRDSAEDCDGPDAALAAARTLIADYLDNHPGARRALLTLGFFDDDDKLIRLVEARDLLHTI